MDSPAPDDAGTDAGVEAGVVSPPPPDAGTTTPLARGSSPFAERALVLLAECESRRGRLEQARAALRDYLARFPNGAHAAEARAALGKS